MIELYNDLCLDLPNAPMRQRPDTPSLFTYLDNFKRNREVLMDFATRTKHKHHSELNLSDARAIIDLLGANPHSLTLCQSLFITACAQPAMGAQPLISAFTGWNNWSDSWLPEFLQAVLPPAQAALCASFLYGDPYAMVSAKGEIQQLSYNMYAAKFPEVWDYPQVSWRPGFRLYNLYEIIDAFFLRYYGVLKLDMAPMIRVGYLLPMSFGDGDKFRGSFPAIAESYMSALLKGACLPYSSSHWRTDENDSDNTTKLSFTAIATV